MTKIHEHVIDGEVADKHRFDARSKMETFAEEQLRETGKVPVIDMNTQWLITYDDDKEKFFFRLKMYGVFVGKKKAKQYVGWEHETDKLV